MFRKACLPDIRYKDTKNGKSLDRIYKKVSIKYRKKKNEQALPNPSPRVRKAQRLFFFTCIKFLLPENQSFFFTSKKQTSITY